MPHDLIPFEQENYHIQAYLLVNHRTQKPIGVKGLNIDRRVHSYATNILVFIATLSDIHLQ